MLIFSVKGCTAPYPSSLLQNVDLFVIVGDDYPSFSQWQMLIRVEVVNLVGE